MALSARRCRFLYEAHLISTIVDREGFSNHVHLYEAHLISTIVDIAPEIWQALTL